MREGVKGVAFYIASLAGLRETTSVKVRIVAYQYGPVATGISNLFAYSGKELP